jgi:hypothetical protein
MCFANGVAIREWWWLLPGLTVGVDCVAAAVLWLPLIILCAMQFSYRHLDISNNQFIGEARLSTVVDLV